MRELEFRNYSPRTVRTYVSMLDQMCSYSGRPDEGFTSEEFKSYLFYCKEKRGLSNSYIKQAISALKILRRCLGLSWDTGIKVKRPRSDGHLPDILSRQEVGFDRRHA